jgi:hypothetical protein
MRSACQDLVGCIGHQQSCPMTVGKRTKKHLQGSCAVEIISAINFALALPFVPIHAVQ